MQLTEIRKAAVLGTGQMGPGIAYTLACAGCTVTLFGRTPESADRGLRAVTAAVETLVRGEVLSPTDGADILARITGSTDLAAAVADADLVTESIAEDLRTKQDLFVRLEGLCPSRTMLTSNTSGLPATQLARPLQRPERFAVTHYWNPPHLMQLVEIVKGEHTSQATIDRLVALLRRAGKQTAVVKKDIPGQLGVRLFNGVIREAIWLVQEGYATPEDVDTAIKNGFGLRFPVWGVFEHLDAQGLDTVLAIQSYMFKELCNDTDAAWILKDKVASGELGARVGRGFYDWSHRDLTAIKKRRDEFLLEHLKAQRRKDTPTA